MTLNINHGTAAAAAFPRTDLGRLNMNIRSIDGFPAVFVIETYLLNVS